MNSIKPQFDEENVSSDPKKRALLKSILIATSSVILLPISLSAQSSTPLAVNKLHSFGLRVSDVDRSLAFYQSIFGSVILGRRESTVFLRIGQGPHFFSLSPLADGQLPAITHIGLSVANYDQNSAEEVLNRFGLRQATSIPSINKGSSLESAMSYWSHSRSEDLFFADREGVNYQLMPTNYCGNYSPDSSCTLESKGQESGLFELIDINHFTTFTANKDRANRFHTQLMGKAFQAYQGDNSPVIGIGDGLQFLMYVGGSEEGQPRQAGRIDHVCFSMKEFSVNGILDKLSSVGLGPRSDPGDTKPLMHWVSLRMPNRCGAEGGTPEVYFSDPDGIRIQLQSESYCGGGGYLGDNCPAI